MLSAVIPGEEMVREAASGWLPILLDAAVKGMVVLSLAGLAVLAMRRASAAARHLVWCLAMVSLPALPILSAVAPKWQVLPDWMAVPAELVEPLASASPAEPIAPQGGLPRVHRADVSPWPVEPAAADPLASRVVEATGMEQAGDRTSVVAGRPVAPEIDPAAEPPEPSRLRSFQTWGLLAWLGGTVLVLLPLGLGTWSLWRLQRSADRITEGPLAVRLRQLAAEMGVTRRVILLRSNRRSMPMHWGIVWPKLLLPAVADEWTRDRQRVVLLHELAHVRRWDCLTQLITQLVCALYWFNPLVWVALRQIHLEREAACDDLILSAGYKPSDYAEHLLQIVSGLQANVFAAYSAIAMARRSRLEGRLRAILDPKRNRRRLTRAAVLVAVAVLVGVMVPVAMMRAADSQEETRDEQVVKEEAATADASATDPSQGDRSQVASRDETMPALKLRLAASGGVSLVREFPNHVVQEQPGLLALQEEMHRFMAVVVAEAKQQQETPKRAGNPGLEGRPPRRVFLGLDLTDAPRETDAAKLHDLFEERPPGSKSYEFPRQGVVLVYDQPGGMVIHIPKKNIFYVQHDPLGSSTLHYYGPFEGDPRRVMSLESKSPPTGLGAPRETETAKRPGGDKEALRDLDVRYAAAVAKIAKAEYLAALEANKRVPGTFPQLDVELLALAHRLAALELDRAKLSGGDKEALRDIDVRCAEVVAEVAKTEHLWAVEINKRVPGTVPQVEVARLALAHRLAALEFERAKLPRGDEEAIRDIDVRRAEAVAEVAKAEYLLAVETNKKVPGTFPQAKLQGLSKVWHRAQLDLVNARKAVQADPASPPPSSDERRDSPGREIRSPWGPVVEPGVHFGIWADKVIWKADEVPGLKADVSHRGTRELRRWGPYELQVDGRWYAESTVEKQRARTYDPQAFRPQTDYRDIQFTLDERWRGKRSGNPLKLGPGRHRMRVALDAKPAEEDAEKPIRLLSNVAEIHILAPGQEVSDQQWLELVAGGTPGSKYTAQRVAAMYRKEHEQDLPPAELAEFYATRAIKLAQTGPDPVLLEDTVEQALALDQDPKTEAQLYVYLGDAHWRQTTKYSPAIWGRQRRIAAEAYLTGLKHLLRHDLPAEPPELPPVARWRVAGPPDVVEAFRRKHARQIEARRQAERICGLVQLRQTLTGQVVQMYARQPDAWDELHKLVVKHLGSEEAARQIVEAAKATRGDSKTKVPAVKALRKPSEEASERAPEGASEGASEGTLRPVGP